MKRTKVLIRHRVRRVSQEERLLGLHSPNGPSREPSHGATDSNAAYPVDHWIRLASICVSTVPSVEVQPGVPPTVSWGYDGVESTARPVYFSHKARVAYRHQMDGNIIDATC
ncbi:uncharacterized protein si:ch211-237l4.6 [Triplophysa dalaica]|uniref:uncharacterized protein si:ch211-237l4.6 n=1 Tax=Triplophysa dalaica TaxID=1582913 RepID=UPI0024DFA623|nr:uncharacterized protein si:ch211-237l4.6 [Triplophysa dalaica]